MTELNPHFTLSSLIEVLEGIKKLKGDLPVELAWWSEGIGSDEIHIFVDGEKVIIQETDPF